MSGMKWWKWWRTTGNHRRRRIPLESGGTCRPRKQMASGRDSGRLYRPQIRSPATDAPPAPPAPPPTTNSTGKRRRRRAGVHGNPSDRDSGGWKKRHPAPNPRPFWRDLNRSAHPSDGWGGCCAGDHPRHDLACGASRRASAAAGPRQNSGRGADVGVGQGWDFEHRTLLIYPSDGAFAFVVP